jgi:hypothetical protein
MSVSKPTRTNLFSLAAAALLSVGLAGAASAAGGANTALDEPYEWNAKLVSYDAATHTAVLEAMVEAYVRIDGLDKMADGDRLILTWTGRYWAGGIRSLEQNPSLTPSSLSLPVEFVSVEHDGRYVDFRIPVPESARGLLAGMEPGTRVTGVSPRMATDWAKGVISLRDYNDVG